MTEIDEYVLADWAYSLATRSECELKRLSKDQLIDMLLAVQPALERYSFDVHFARPQGKRRLPIQREVSDVFEQVYHEHLERTGKPPGRHTLVKVATTLKHRELRQKRAAKREEEGSLSERTQHELEKEGVRINKIFSDTHARQFLKKKEADEHFPEFLRSTKRNS